MSTATYSREQRAYDALVQVMREADEARGLFVEAGLPIPAPLSRLFAETAAAGSSKRSQTHVSIPPLESPAKPPTARDDWIWVKLKDAMAATLALSVLDRADGPIAPKLILDEVMKIRPDIVSGSIYNVGPRLDKAGILERSESGWKLLSPVGAPIVKGEHVWGPPSIFQKQEVAAHRRYVIKHILGASGPLQVMQIVLQLQQYGECRAPFNKDLVKADMEALQQADEVKRIGNAKKYQLTEEKK